jgi:putative transposase
MENRRITFRLYPKKQAIAKLHYARKLHWMLYNAAIADRRTQYERFGKSINYYQQQNCLPKFKETWIEYKELGSHTLQNTLKRADNREENFVGLKPMRHGRMWNIP